MSPSGEIYISESDQLFRQCESGQFIIGAGRDDALALAIRGYAHTIAEVRPILLFHRRQSRAHIANMVDVVRTFFVEKRPFEPGASELGHEAENVCFLALLVALHCNAVRAVCGVPILLRSL